MSARPRAPAADTAAAGRRVPLPTACCSYRDSAGLPRFFWSKRLYRLDMSESESNITLCSTRQNSQNSQDACKARPGRQERIPSQSQWAQSTTENQRQLCLPPSQNQPPVPGGASAPPSCFCGSLSGTLLGSDRAALSSWVPAAGTRRTQHAARRCEWASGKGPGCQAGCCIMQSCCPAGGRQAGPARSLLPRR